MDSKKIALTDILLILGKLITDQRVARNISQLELGQMLNPPTSQQIISRYERTGYMNTSLNRIVEIIKIIELYPLPSDEGKLEIDFDYINKDMVEFLEWANTLRNSDGTLKTLK